MAEDSEQKRKAADSFNKYASAYVESPIHQSGDDLETLAKWCANAEQALDIATGAGHTVGAVHKSGVLSVVATDAAPNMVATAKAEFPSIIGAVADAEQLPFQDDTFDAVTCRIAAHHFPHPETFVNEVARVTESGGVFAFEDNIAPEDEQLDEFLNSVERLRDPTHHRSYTESEWCEWFQAAGFDIEEHFVIKKIINYQNWVEKLNTPAENRRELKELFRNPPEGAEELFEIQTDNESILSFANLKILLCAHQ